MPYRCLYSPIMIGPMEVPESLRSPSDGEQLRQFRWELDSDQSRAYYEARAAGLRFDNHRGYRGASRAQKATP